MSTLRAQSSNNFPNSTLESYGNNFPNTSLPNYLLINAYNGNFPNSTLGTYNGDFPNSTVLTKTTLAQVNSSAQIGESQVTNLVTDLGSKLNIATYAGNFPNGTLSGYGNNFPNNTLANYGNNFPNTSLPNYLLINTYNSDFPNNTLSGYGNNFPNTTLGTSISNLQSNDSAHDSKISTIQSNETGYAKLDGSRTVTGNWNWGGFNLTNALRVVASFFEGDGSRLSNLNASNLTGTFNASTDARTNFPNNTVALKEASWDGKTTLAEVNQSADLYNMNASNITSGQIPNVSRLPAGTVILIDANETDSTAITVTTATSSETTLMTFGLPSNSFKTIIVEAEVDARLNLQAAEYVEFTWRFNESTTNRETVIWRLVAINTAGVQERKSATLKTSFLGGQVATTTLNLTGRVSASSTTSSTFLARSFRVYGVVGP